MTATLTSHQILPTNLYNFYGGSIDLLPNGNIEYVCGVGAIAANSYIYVGDASEHAASCVDNENLSDQCLPRIPYA